MSERYILIRAEEEQRLQIAGLFPFPQELIERFSETLPQLTEGMTDSHRKTDLTKAELNDLYLKSKDMFPDQTFLVGLTAYFIFLSTGTSLFYLSSNALDKNQLPAATLFSDLSYGVMISTQQAMFAAELPNLDKRDLDNSTDRSFEKFEKENYILQETTEIDIRQILLNEDKLQLKLLSEDPTGNSLMDYCVQIIDELIDESQQINPNYPRIKNFVMAGANVAREAYKIVYPLAKEIVK